MFTTKTFVATDMFRSKKTPLSEFFRISMLSAIGQCLVEKSSYGYSNGKGHWILSVYPNEVLLKAVSPSTLFNPRILWEFRNATSKGPALVRGEIENATFAITPSDDRGEKVSGSFELELPDQILGLDDIALQHKGNLGLYRGLYFNLTPGEEGGNLYNLFDKVAMATSETYLALEAGAQERAIARREALAQPA